MNRVHDHNCWLSALPFGEKVYEGEGGGSDGAFPKKGWTRWSLRSFPTWHSVIQIISDGFCQRNSRDVWTRIAKGRTLLLPHAIIILFCHVDFLIGVCLLLYSFFSFSRLLSQCIRILFYLTQGSSLQLSLSSISCSIIPFFIPF